MLNNSSLHVSANQISINTKLIDKKTMKQQNLTRLFESTTKSLINSSNYSLTSTTSITSQQLANMSYQSLAKNTLEKEFGNLK